MRAPRRRFDQVVGDVRKELPRECRVKHSRGSHKLLGLSYQEARQLLTLLLLDLLMLRLLLLLLLALPDSIP